MREAHVERAVAAARALIDTLPATLVYHDREHSLGTVLPAAERFAADEGLDEHVRGLIAIAAAFHDTGFLERYRGHEDVSVRFAEAAMRPLGFDEADIAAVRGMILATRLPQTPHTLAEQILADADLDSLGRDDFETTNALLRQELASVGTVLDDAAWLAQQAAFLRGHVYFTEAARRARDAGKRLNLTRLEELARTLRDR